jgi:hypothetical protein
MMHLTFAEKDLILGDTAAETVVAYAAALARNGSADAVKVIAYGADGDKVTATLLLDTGAPLMIESSQTDLPEPDNTEIVAYMTERLTALETPRQAAPVSDYDSGMAAFENDYDTDAPGTTRT